MVRATWRRGKSEVRAEGTSGARLLFEDLRLRPTKLELHATPPPLGRSPLCYSCIGVRCHMQNVATWGVCRQGLCLYSLPSTMPGTQRAPSNMFSVPEWCWEQRFPSV